MQSVIQKIGWLYVKDKTLLGVRPIGKEMFQCPGGKPKPGESQVDTLTREVQEELSVQILRSSVKYLSQHVFQADNKPVGTMVSISFYAGKHHGDLRPGKEIEEALFLDTSNLRLVSPESQKVLIALKHLGIIR